jgi:hypothetical protein
MTSVGFEPTFSADEWPQTYAVDRAITGTGSQGVYSEGKENNFLLIAYVSVIKDRIPALYSLMSNGESAAKAALWSPATQGIAG